MNSLRSARFPFSPYPIGWYGLAFAAELRRGMSLTRTFMRRELRLSRSADGLTAAVDQHGRLWPLNERGGVVLVFHHPQVAAPTWQVAPESEEWGVPVGQVWRVRTHPQEVIENTVDFAHFGIVHGYRAVEAIGEVAVDGPYLRMAYDVTRTNGIFGRFDSRPLRFRIEICASGVGYSKVEISIPSLHLRVRQVVMPTPVDGEVLDLRATTQVKFGLAPAPKGAWPHRAAARLVAHFVARAMGQDVSPDFRIWENKRYVERPRLVKGDGPIARYRHWARQFYVDAGSAEHQLGTAGLADAGARIAVNA